MDIVLQQPTLYHSGISYGKCTNNLCEYAILILKAYTWWSFSEQQGTGYGGRAGPALTIVATKQLGTAAITALIVTATRVTRVLGFVVGRVS